MLTYFGSPGIDGASMRPDVSGTFDRSQAHQRSLRSEYSGPVAIETLEAASPLLVNLRRFGFLDTGDVEAIHAIAASAKLYPAGKILFHEGRSPDHVYLFVHGMGCRYKLSPSGQRQILGFLIPGDLCDVQFLAPSPPDHSVTLLSDAKLVKIPTRRLQDLLADRPCVDRALELAAIQDFSILREWLLNVGQRNALEKLAHLFCEMQVRLESVGQVDDDGSIELPVNQLTLADTTGLTPVHVNRTLQRLRREGLIRLCQRRLMILDFERLAAVAGFDGSYLRVKRSQL